MNGGRAGGMGLRIWQETGLRKFRARRAPCLWQGAADLKAYASAADPFKEGNSLKEPERVYLHDRTLVVIVYVFSLFVVIMWL